MLDNTAKKAIADQLARLMMEKSTDRPTLEELARELAISLGDEGKTPVPVRKPKEIHPDRVGVWKREEKNGEIFYHRNPEMKDDWVYWAQIPSIPPKTARKRIVYLGESVARGYLYDPYYYPTQVLGGVLDRSGLLEAEIVDLAKVNLDLPELHLLTDECLALDPDAIVIFSGNNWVHSIKNELTKEDMREMDRILGQKGISGLHGFLTARCVAEIRKYTEKLATISRAKGIAIFIIVPEFNLLDWKTSRNEKILTALSNGDLQDWVAARNEAMAALAADDVDRALELAERMIRLDDSHPTGYDVAAEVCLRTGRNAAARRYLEAARDTALFARAYSKPRSYVFVRETLLESRKYDFNIIDLPGIFSENKDGALPGRDLFLDYCHLSEEGIQLAMAATAQTLIAHFTGRKPDLAALSAAEFVADGDVRAMAYICASVHNAHYGQEHDVLDYLSRQAIESSPVAVEIMRNYVDFASRRTTTTLCRSHEQLVENEFINQYGGGVGFMHRPGNKVMDIKLVDAMLRALSDAGVDLEDSVRLLRKSEHGLDSGKRVELTESFYCSTAYDIYPGTMPEYFQSREAESDFFVVSGSGQSADLSITFRTPFRGAPADKVRLFINSAFLESFPSSERWQTRTLVVPADLLADGLNVLRIEWSTTFEFGLNTREVPLSEDYIFNKVYHVYGEISSFTATIS